MMRGVATCYLQWMEASSTFVMTYGTSWPAGIST